MVARYWRVGRTAIELRESAADGAVHELPEPAGARRYGQNFRAHRLMVRIPDPQVNPPPAGRFVRADRVVELGCGRAFLPPGAAAHDPAVHGPGVALGRQRAVVQHMLALPHGAVADALATVRTSRALVTTKDAFELLVLTAARSGEVRLATWDEMDLDAGVWTIPAARMKAKRDHRVPLSGRALEILHDARRRSDGTGLVFRSPRGKPLSDMTLSKLIKELGIAAVPHGFRSSFRDWAAEQTNTPREVVEAALAHTVRNPTEAAYARSDLFERRRLLMNDWAAYLSGARGHVVA